jgi:hypothetical protein
VEEAELVKSIIQELRGTLAVDVDPEPIMERWPSQPEQRNKCYLVVGSSHAARLAAALTSLGIAADTVQEPHWRIFRNSASALAEKVTKKMEEKCYDHIIFAVLDNSVYSAMAMTGDIIPSRRDNEGHYHIDGELVISSKSSLHVLLNALKPLLTLGLAKGGVLVSPLPRYLTSGCCMDLDHMPDRTSLDFKNRMLSELQDMAGNIRNFHFTSNLRGIKLLDLAGVLKNHCEEDSWDNDPVHPKNKIYEEMAKLSVTLCEQAGEINIKKRPRRDSDGSGGPTAIAGTAPDLHGRSDGPSERPPGSRATHSGRRGHPGGVTSGRGMRGFSFGAVDVRTLDAAHTAGDSESRRHRQGDGGRNIGRDRHRQRRRPWRWTRWRKRRPQRRRYAWRWPWRRNKRRLRD